MKKTYIVAGYLFATGFVVFGTILLAAYGNGYSYDFKTGRLVHRGLLILESKPSGAAVALNGKDIDKKTPYRESFEEGRYDLTLIKENYRTWNKSLNVIPSRVNLAQYVILLPVRFQVEPVTTFPAVTQSLANRDRRRIAYNVPSGQSAGINILDTDNRNFRRVYSLSTPQSGQSAEIIEIMAWSNDGSRLLIKQTIGDKVSHLVVHATGDDAVINLTSDYKQNFSDIRFSQDSWRVLYWNSSEGLRRIDVASQSLSEPLTGPAAGFAFAGDRLLYVAAADPQKSLWMLEQNGRKSQLVESLPQSSTYQIAYSTYINVPQIVVSATDARSTVLVSDALERPVVHTIADEAAAPLFNGDGRFVVLHGANGLATYDLELGQLYRFSDINKNVTGITWFDNYHLQFNRDGQSVISEFDGNYANVITRGDRLAPSNSQDYRYLFTTSQTSTGETLVKALKLKL